MRVKVIGVSWSDCHPGSRKLYDCRPIAVAQYDCRPIAEIPQLWATDSYICQQKGFVSKSRHTRLSHIHPG